VQRAASVLRWTGSGQEALVAIDPRGAVALDEPLRLEIAAALERVRRIGHEVVVVPARYVPVELGLEIDLRPGTPRAVARAALREALARLAHPDRWSFGDPVLSGPFLAAAQAIPGVEAVTLTRLRRSGQPGPEAPEAGVLPMGRLEIARLDEDPGVLRIALRGGR
jgi:hypothetical protein